MRHSWRGLFRRLACGGAAAWSAAWSSAVCYAQIAADFATDPVYADGWAEGDNGGTGFTAWNFDGSYDSTVQHAIDTAPFDTYNNIGTAWKLFNPVVIPTQRDIARAGRGFAPLQVGQTVRTVIDNPTEQQFFRGYFVRLNGGTGGVNGNICYAGEACTPGGTPDSKLTVRVFEYFTYGKWAIAAESVEPDITPPAGDGFSDVELVDADTAASGVQIDMTLTGTDAYRVVMTPLANPGMAVTRTGMLETPGVPVDWIEFTFFNTQSATGAATDFYIKSIEILGAAPPGVPGDYNKDGTVNAADYVIYRDHAGQTFQLENEVVTPGMVTPEDYTAWAARFGNTSGAGAGSSFAAAVPEPGAIGIVVVCVSSWLVLARRRD